MDERAAYRRAVEALLWHLRARCRTADDLATSYDADRHELLNRAAVAVADASLDDARLSPLVALDAAVFERARELISDQ